MTRLRFFLAFGITLTLLIALAGCLVQRGVGVKGSQAAIRRDTGSRTWREPITGMEFVKVPGGSFEMGCHSGNGGQCDADEKTVRTVRLDGFWLGKHEVTVDQYMKFVRDTGGNHPQWLEQGGKDHHRTGSDDHYRKLGSALTRGNRPVVGVSWNNAVAFARWLSQKTGKTFRLPSEAQWEFACRAGGKQIKFGTADGRLTSRSGNSKGTQDGHEFTAPVGSYPPNSLGLHDMSGNVLEWVADNYTENYRNVGTDNPIYQSSGVIRVYRGGSWHGESGLLRCSIRGSSVPSDRANSLGFRLRRSR